MTQPQSQVRPHVNQMPHEGFYMQTGGSARRRVIKNISGQQTEGVYKVSGVPGHTHNASAVVSVLVDLEEKRNVAYEISDDWAYAPVALAADDVGDSTNYGDEYGPFNRAIERGIGQIAIRPENCHQEIDEPVRSIAEVRTLVSPELALDTLTYVEEVGGYVNPQTKAAYISDYPDVEVDIVGPNDLDDIFTANVGGVVRVTGHPFLNTTITPTETYARAADHSGFGYNFVVRRTYAGDGHIGTKDDGSPWHGTVTFSWDPTDRRYKSQEFFVTLADTVECGPVQQDGTLFNQAINVNLGEGATANNRGLRIKFPSLLTSVAESGYCVLSQAATGTQALMTGTGNGSPLQPLIPVDVFRSGLRTVGAYGWRGCPATRIVVGGTHAIPGPSTDASGTQKSYWESLRNMTPTALIQRAEASYAAIVAIDDNWAQDNAHATDLVHYEAAFGNMLGFQLLRDDNKRQVPRAGLPRNTVRGSSWYPVAQPFTSLTYMQNRHGFDGAVIADSGGLFVGRTAPAGATLVAKGITAATNPMKYVFRGTGHLPPYAATLPPPSATNTDYAEFLANEMPTLNERVHEVALDAATQPRDAKQTEIDQKQVEITASQATLAAIAVAVAALADDTNHTQELLTPMFELIVGPAPDPWDLGQAIIALTGGLAAATAVAQQALAGFQAELTVLKTELVPLQAQVDLVESKKIPPFAEWNMLPEHFDYKLHLSMTGIGQIGTIDYDGTIMVPLHLRYWAYHRVQDFAYGGDPPTFTHIKPALFSARFHLLCDVHHALFPENTLAATGDIRELFNLNYLFDQTDNNVIRNIQVQGLELLTPTSTAASAALALAAIAIAVAATALAQAAYNAAAGGDQTDELLALERAQDHELYVTQYSANEGDANADWSESVGVGNLLPIRTHLPIAHAATTSQPIICPHSAPGGIQAQYPNAIVLQDIAFGFEKTRYGFIQFNDIGYRDAPVDPTTVVFSTADCDVVPIYHAVGGSTRVHVCTRINQCYRVHNGALGVFPAATFVGALANSHGGMRREVCIGMFNADFQGNWFGNAALPGQPETVFDDRIAESTKVGPVFWSQRRISQHICAPVLNPNARIGCSAPLNYETLHLPPELRDFRLELRDVNWDFLPGAKTLEDLVLYEFNGGNQAIAAEDNLLHLPQFRETVSTDVAHDGSFDFEVFSPQGMPSYLAIFARDSDFSQDAERQPLIRQLSIMCSTTQKRSNTILNAGIHQLYHITQRNVHPGARYDRTKYNRRQVVLLSAEDVGLMGLDLAEYQKEKRAVFRFQGTVDQIAQVTALLIYNNRGLYIDGKQLSVVRLN